jgi:hypothetical protein
VVHLGEVLLETFVLHEKNKEEELPVNDYIRVVAPQVEEFPVSHEERKNFL